MKNDTALKIVGYSFLGLLVFWLVKGILFPTGYGMTVRYNMPGYIRTGSEHGYMTNYGMTSFGSSILQILLIVFVITLLVGVVMIIKNSLFTSTDIATLKGTLTSKSLIVPNPCAQCGKELNSEWKVCPYCGNDVNHSEEKKN